MLRGLLELETTYDLLRKLKESDQTSSENMIKYYYDTLKCQMKSLDKESDEYAQLKDYVKNSHGPTHTSYKLNVEEIIELDREGEKENFNHNLQNRVLLFPWISCNKFCRHSLQRSKNCAKRSAIKWVHVWQRHLFCRDGN